MTNKKIVIIIVSIVVGLGLLVVLFIGGIVGVALYSIGQSEAATTAKSFLRENERLKQDIGEVKDFGSIVTGNVNTENNNGTATLNIKVIGERKEVNATVDLTFRNGQPWRVVGASYTNDAGEVVELVPRSDTRIHIQKLAA
ncbi:MAG TPA: cytochrome c oxidase assembly factor Coa1 family protein [Pyrinomonadaceae bacterium]|nr:cytochrome c oxidase assembly factor Coa1 family protein [Pyrinomonadaceae bacterium]